jgi:TonB family protein
MKKAWFLSVLLHVAICGALFAPSGKKVNRPLTSSSNVELIYQPDTDQRKTAPAHAYRKPVTTADTHSSAESASEADSALTASGTGEIDEFRPSPKYPSAALKDGIEGDIMIEVKTDRFGKVKDIELIQGSGHSVLDAEALTTVRNWRLQPLKVIRVPIAFHINS